MEHPLALDNEVSQTCREEIEVVLYSRMSTSWLELDPAAGKGVGTRDSGRVTAAALASSSSRFLAFSLASSSLRLAATAAAPSSAVRLFSASSSADRLASGNSLLMMCSASLDVSCLRRAGLMLNSSCHL